MRPNGLDAVYDGLPSDGVQNGVHAIPSGLVEGGLRHVLTAVVYGAVGAGFPERPQVIQAGGGQDAGSGRSVQRTSRRPRHRRGSGRSPRPSPRAA